MNFRPKIITGDCLEVLPTIEDKSIDMLFTDPPFNISHANGDIIRKNSKNPHYRFKGKNIKRNIGEWDKFDTDDNYWSFMVQWIEIANQKLKKDCNFVCFIAKEKVSYLEDILREYGFRSRNVLAWIKKNPVPQLRKVNFASALEFILWCSRGNNTFNYKLGHSPNYMFLPIVGGKERNDHPAQKPEKLVSWIIQYLSNEGDIILDPFTGSGTIPRIAMNLKRHSVGIEIDSKYVKMAKNRCGLFNQIII